jgi:hypothetical protein
VIELGRREHLDRVLKAIVGTVISIGRFVAPVVFLFHEAITGVRIQQRAE